MYFGCHFCIFSSGEYCGKVSILWFCLNFSVKIGKRNSDGKKTESRIGVKKQNEILCSMLIGIRKRPVNYVA